MNGYMNLKSLRGLKSVAGLLGMVWITAAFAQSSNYDPLSEPYAWRSLDTTAAYPDGTRTLPLRIYLPQTDAPAPVLLFSHGLGGSREGSAYLGRHWAARGYAAVFVQHPGSDEAVWKQAPPGQQRATLSRAAGGEQFLHRVHDIPVVLDALARWNAERGQALSGRFDLARIGMSGHSFGAVTTQAVSGQAMDGRTPFFDTRIKAALAFSPSPPRRGDANSAFAQVKIPWLLMTGTRDAAAIGGITPAMRLQVYPALPAGGKYELVLDGAEHLAFTDRPARTGETRNPNHHRAILALSTAFWDAWLKQDAASRHWLDGDGPRTVLQTKDRWQHK